jgi:hypothetical protein
MASDKQKRKAAKAARPTTRKGGAHPDGDRRRRGGPTADQALADKKARQQFPGALPPEDPSKG